MSANVYNTVGGGFGAIASAFVIESLQHMLVWLIVMTAVVVCDLVTGLAKCIKSGTQIRFSRAIRETMAKFCTYYACVVAVAMTQVASGTEWEIEKYTCMFIIVIEASSVAGNILKMKGYDIDFNKIFTAVVARKLEVDKEDLEGVITKSENDETSIKKD